MIVALNAHPLLVFVSAMAVLFGSFLAVYTTVTVPPYEGRHRAPRPVRDAGVYVGRHRAAYA